MDKEDVVCIYDHLCKGILFIPEKEGTFAIYTRLDEFTEHYVKWKKLHTERQIPSVLIYM